VKVAGRGLRVALSDHIRLVTLLLIYLLHLYDFILPDYSRLKFVA